MKILLVLGLYLLSNSFYNLTIPMQDGSTLSLSKFEGKKVLIVNIASGSAGIGQLKSLSDLQQKYDSSLAVIAVPSNSFGKEPMTNDQLKDYMKSHDINVWVTTKSDLTGEGIMALYKWLQNESDNDVGSFNISENFQKFLINEKGMIIGIFGGSVDPLDDNIQDAVKTLY